MISIIYLAGFIDGEGCFVAHSTQKASPSIVIVNTDKDILDEISDSIEMWLGKRPNPKTKWQPEYTNAKPCYNLRLGAPILRKLLPRLIPHMRIKRQQAEWMLELIALIPTIHGPHSQGRATETWNERQDLVDKIMWANQGYP